MCGCGGGGGRCADARVSQRLRKAPLICASAGRTVEEECAQGCERARTREVHARRARAQTSTGGLRGWMPRPFDPSNGPHIRVLAPAPPGASGSPVAFTQQKRVLEGARQTPGAVSAGWVGRWVSGVRGCVWRWEVRGRARVATPSQSGLDMRLSKGAPWKKSARA